MRPWKEDAKANEDAGITRFSTVSLTYVIRGRNSEHARAGRTGRHDKKRETWGVLFLAASTYSVLSVRRAS